MYRATYPFATEDRGCLSFKKGDVFTLLDCSKDEHWWQVLNVNGQSGYVPANYLVKDNSVSQDDVVKSIDRAIEFIHLAATNSGGVLSHQQRHSLQKLVEHRQSVLQGNSISPVQPKRQAPTVSKSPQGNVPRRTSTKSRAAPPPPERTTPELSPQTNFPTPQTTSSSNQSAPSATSPEKTTNNTLNLETFDVPSGLLTEIVEQVRDKTGLSFDKSKAAVRIVLGKIALNVPELALAMERIQESSLSNEEASTSVVLEGGKDFERLEVIFTELVSCKDDSQQRSWALHEDEAIISEYLEELQAILSDADARVSRAVIQKNNYDYLSSMVLYYQMEHRVRIRLLLLRAFGGICGLDLGALSHLLGTILPVEIARDVKTDRENFTKMCYSSLLLVMLFSAGELLPVTHYDQLGEDFVSFLLDFIEDPPDDEDAEQLPDLFVKVLLAYNLHFQDPSTNILMTVLAKRGQCKSFSEKIMLLVNRGADPVKVLDHKTDAPDSLLKFMLDVFSSQITSQIFYTNDMMVLIDIIVRQLTDLSPGDRVRTENLLLIFKIFKNTSYWEHRHRVSDLETVFGRISLEEDSASLRDQSIVQEIQTSFDQKLSGSA